MTTVLILEGAKLIQYRFLSLIKCIEPNHFMKQGFHCHFYLPEVNIQVKNDHGILSRIALYLLNAFGPIYFSMTTLLTHTVAHSTKPSFKPKTNNQPLKKFLSLALG